MNMRLRSLCRKLGDQLIADFSTPTFMTSKRSFWGSLNASNNLRLLLLNTCNILGICTLNALQN